MKKLFLLLIPGTLWAQQKEDQNVVQGSDLLMSRKASANLKVDGSPYIQKDYETGTTTNSTKMYQIRYDAFADEMEFKQDGTILIANKIIGQKFKLDNKTYTTIRYTNDKNDQTVGYLVELIANPGGYSLYKKELVTKIDAIQGLNSYQASKNSYYERQKDQFIISYDNKFYYVPSNARKFEGELKNLTDEYQKKNRLKLDEKGLIDFVNFINK